MILKHSRVLILLSSFIILSYSLVLSSAQAQITTDGALGQSKSLSGPDYTISADLGKQNGGNLFHSFSEFNLSMGERATFTGPDSVDNIISRVTGGNKSRIDGILRSQIPGADLFFLQTMCFLVYRRYRYDSIFMI